MLLSNSVPRALSKIAYFERTLSHNKNQKNHIRTTSVKNFLMDFQILCIMIHSGLSCTRNIQFGYWLCMAIDNLLVSEE